MGQEKSTGGGLNISSAPSPNSAPPTSHTSGHKRKVSEWVWVEAPYGFLRWKSCLEPMASTDSSSHTAQAGSEFILLGLHRSGPVTHGVSFH